MFKLESGDAQSFEFEFEGKKYTIPSRLGLPMKRFRKIQKAISQSDDKEETLFDEIMGVFDEYAPDVMDKLTLGQAMELFTAYSTDEDAPSLGES